jgi:putative mycofactocin binding protein MftB
LETVSVVIDPSAAYRLHPNVAVRPEPFGALVYHYGNRKLVFLKSMRMVAVVQGLGSAASVTDALHIHGVAERNVSKYLDALTNLLSSDMLVAVSPNTDSDSGASISHAC